MWKRLASRFSFRSFRGRIMLTLSAICTGIILIVGISSNQLASEELLRMSTKLSENNARSAERQVGAYLDKVSDYTTQVLRISEFQDLQKVRLTREEAARRKTRAAVSVYRQVNSAAENGVTFHAMEFYSRSGFSYQYPSTYATNFGSYEGCLDALSRCGMDASGQYTRTQWILCPMQDQRGRRTESCLVCVRFLYDSLMQKQGVLVAALDNAEFGKTYGNYAVGSFILNSGGVVYSSSEPAAIGKAYGDEALKSLILEHAGALTTFSYRNGAGRDVMYSCYPIMDQSAVLVIPFNYYTGISRQETVKYTASMALLPLMMIVLSLFLSARISAGLSNDLQDLTNTVKRVYSGQTELRCPVGGTDEVAYLGAKINDMLDSIVASMREREKELEAKRLLEGKLMQSQINPHLLYNTLDTVLWNLQSNRPESAVTLVEALSGFFKHALSKGSSTVALRDEIRLIRYYLEIQHLAREQDIELILDIPPELLDMPVIKLSLQPAIENAVIHGFAGYRDDGQIRVEAVRDGAFLKIVITDNGIGMTPEELDSLRLALAQYPPPEHMKYFGLYNINWRIKHTYGSEYGVSVNSVVSEYTAVTELLPLPAGGGPLSKG